MSSGILSRVRDPAQFIVAGVLVVLGILVINDALSLSSVVAGNDRLGPKPVPIVLGISAIGLAVWYTVDILKGGVGEQEAGEDVDTSAKTSWGTLALLMVAFILNALLIEPLGWVISSSLMYWLSAFALGSRRYIRSLVIGVVLALITFYGFSVGLGVNLPAGVLQGIL